MKKSLLRIAVAFVMLGLLAGFLPTAALANGETYDVVPYKTAGTYPTSDGKVFAGWFEDEALTVPYTALTGNAYAKFVNGGVLGVKAQLKEDVTLSSESADLRLITTVDSAYYASAGFFISVNGKEQRIDLKTVYSSVCANDGTVYKPTDISDSSAFFMTYVLAGVPSSMFDTAINVVPFWQTLDGTVVRGTGRDIVISDQFDKPVE